MTDIIAPLVPAITKQGRVHDLLRELALVTGIAPVPDDLPTFVAVTQRAWLRDNCERWEVDAATWEPHRAQIMPLLQALGIATPQLPLQPVRCRYLVIHGSEARSFAGRLVCAAQLIDQQVVVPEQIVVLNGLRKLDQIEHDYLSELDLYLPPDATEADMQMLLYDQPAYQILQQLSTMMVIGATPYGQPRSTTVSTLEWWFDVYQPDPGLIVAVSNVPFIRFQDAVLRSVLPDAFDAITIGGDDLVGEPLVVYLDSVARWLYQELQIVEQP